MESTQRPDYWFPGVSAKSLTDESEPAHHSARAVHTLSHPRHNVPESAQRQDWPQRDLGTKPAVLCGVSQDNAQAPRSAGPTVSLPFVPGSVVSLPASRNAAQRMADKTSSQLFFGEQMDGCCYRSVLPNTWKTSPMQRLAMDQATLQEFSSALETQDLIFVSPGAAVGPQECNRKVPDSAVQGTDGPEPSPSKWVKSRDTSPGIFSTQPNRGTDGPESSQQNWTQLRDTAPGISSQPQSQFMSENSQFGGLAYWIEMFPAERYPQDVTPPCSTTSDATAETGSCFFDRTWHKWSTSSGTSRRYYDSKHF